MMFHDENIDFDYNIQKQSTENLTDNMVSHEYLK